MSEKRKISGRKIIQLLVTTVAASACIVAILSAAKKQDNKKVNGIAISIVNSKYHFIDKNEIETMLISHNMDVAHMLVSKVNINRMEKMLVGSPWVAGAQVYVDNNNVIHINVSQRVPVARLFDQAGNSYYLDHTLRSMPLSKKYTHYTTVVTNVPVLGEDSNSRKLKAEIVALVSYIDRDTFWNAQISQIMLTDDKTFELVPVIGNHKILIGDTTNIGKKFNDLYAFYKKVLNRIGWDKYEVLDIRYAGQVVASPALPWKVPVDKAMSSMNWVKAIIGSDTSSARVVTMPADKPVLQTVATIAPVLPKPVVVKTTTASTVKQVPVVTKTVATPHQAATVPQKKSIATVSKPAKSTVVKEKKPQEVKPKSANKTAADKPVENKEQTPKYIYQTQ